MPLCKVQLFAYAKYDLSFQVNENTVTDGRRISPYNENCLTEQVTKFAEVWGYAKCAAGSAIFVDFY